MIILADSSPLITLSRAGCLELLHEIYGEVIVSREVYDEITVAGAGLPGANEVRHANWIRTETNPETSLPEVLTACANLGAGERSIIYLASALTADLVLIDDERARRAAKSVGLTIAGSIAILEWGAMRNRIPDLRSAYLNLLQQGIRYDRQLPDHSLERLGLAKL